MQGNNKIRHQIKIVCFAVGSLLIHNFTYRAASESEFSSPVYIRCHIHCPRRPTKFNEVIISNDNCCSDLFLRMSSTLLPSSPHLPSSPIYHLPSTINNISKSHERQKARHPPATLQCPLPSSAITSGSPRPTDHNPSRGRPTSPREYARLTFKIVREGQGRFAQIRNFIGRVIAGRVTVTPTAIR